MGKLALIVPPTLLVVFSIAHAARKTSHDSLASAHLPPPPFPHWKRLIPSISERMYVSSRTTFLKAAAPDNAVATLLPNTLLRSFGYMGSKQPGTMEHFSRRCQWSALLPR